MQNSLRHAAQGSHVKIGGPLTDLCDVGVSFLLDCLDVYKGLKLSLGCVGTLSFGGGELTSGLYRINRLLLKVFATRVNDSSQSGLEVLFHLALFRTLRSADISWWSCYVVYFKNFWFLKLVNS